MANSKTHNSSKAVAKKQVTQKKPANSKISEPVKSKTVREKSMAKSQKTAIVFMASAVFLIFLTLIEGESVWTYMHNGILGLFGYCAYLWPLMLIYLAIMFALNKPLGSLVLSLSGIAAFIVLIGGAIHIFANEETYLRDEAIGLQISAAWGERVTTPNGGVFGALVGGFIAKLFGKAGAQVTVIIFAFVMLMFLSGTTLFSLFRIIAKPVRKVGNISTTIKEKKVQDQADFPDSKKAFNPPKVLPDSEFIKETGTHPLDEYVPIVPVETPVDKIFTSGSDTQVEISIPNFRRNNSSSNIEENDLKTKTKKEMKLQSSGSDSKDENALKNNEAAESIKPYKLPPIDCLSDLPRYNTSNSDDELRINGQKLIETLKSFGVHAKILMISKGPSVTRYELQPEAGVRINRITNLADDIALRLAAPSVRIEAPIPNKSAIGVEVPNRTRANVSIREIVDTDQFRTAKSKLNVALGKDITGNVVCADLVKMPHLLIAGTTGSGKSVCINSLIVSLLYNASPEEVKLLLIDPKAVELAPYNGIAHLEVPVVSDPRKAAGALGWAVSEMTNRYKLFTEFNVREVDSYNKLAEKTDGMKKMHKIVIFIDELNDLMMIAPHEVEDSICRLAQMARAAGMHLVVATQRPSVDVITGIIKANIPSRIALSVSSQVDSRTIIDMAGAEKLLGSGDMLFNPVGIAKPVRLQGCFISDKEIENTVNFIKAQSQATYDEQIMKDIEMHAVATKKKNSSLEAGEDGERTDEMLPKAIEVVVEAQMASTTLLQRKLKLGYARAANLIDTLEERRIVGPFEGSKPRHVLISKQQWMEMNAMNTEGIPDAFMEDNE